MSKTLRETIDIYNELLRVHQLNIELLNTLEQTVFSIQDFCIKHHIPFCDEKLGGLITKIDCLLEEINNSSLPNTLWKRADEKKHLNGTDEDVPAPSFGIY